MVDEKEVKKLLEKVEKITKEKKLDLSSDEDLSIGIMNLISIEEHLFFTAEKTGKSKYYLLLKEVREMRVELLKKIIKDYEGEVWCISKHLLSSSMRMMEVGTKQLGKGNSKEAQEFFEKAYRLYSLFWAINLDLIEPDMVKDKVVSKEDIKKIREEENINEFSSFKEDDGFFKKVKSALKKTVDCCKE
jgi:hypothetical protein